MATTPASNIIIKKASSTIRLYKLTCDCENILSNSEKTFSVDLQTTSARVINIKASSEITDHDFDFILSQHESTGYNDHDNFYFAENITELYYDDARNMFITCESTITGLLDSIFIKIVNNSANPLTLTKFTLVYEKLQARVD